LNVEMYFVAPAVLLICLSTSVLKSVKI
jgi:hypothetical protein